MNIFKVDGKFNLGDLIINLLIPLGGSFIISQIINTSVVQYEVLNKPVFAPPSVVFPIVWPILYILMGIASYRIYLKNKAGFKTNRGLTFYSIQLSLNFLWSIIFFNFKLYGLAFIELILLFLFIIITIFKFIKLDKISAILMVPYAIWVTFAGVLNYFIWMLNEM
ncbi:TspO/MBR family protein [Clostridium tarantellae]|uniref:Tryptophan-rich sensory protein n=1 Tax=Clostridium tarantellae TaxID=39493 RepID=A0A6I1MP24_9CLOT|nr:TspO/MBR family protein [Clostridium tarantellae]MPQ45175.1 tryptophan-rich sensory protein [Clostridium tarantellae]